MTAPLPPATRGHGGWLAAGIVVWVLGFGYAGLAVLVWLLGAPLPIGPVLGIHAGATVASLLALILGFSAAARRRRRTGSGRLLAGVAVAIVTLVWVAAIVAIQVLGSLPADAS